ncbi:uncharacterized protein PAC_01101 [Phialocephala subalpina]|uniref:Uncharacterized protein n=1 Tax=Phialocephala subalpina TaxID=576137 RepID=A0A1L7WEN0_9HELO|nr:uncharacterized protein PAC_01101 [Phialocephala subalpina]
MGWFDGVSESGSSHRRKSSSGRHHSSSHSHKDHSSPRASSIFGLGDPKHSSSRSIFGSGDHKHNSSRSSFFGFGGHRSSSSAYKRSPRGGYLKRIYSQLRRLLRDLMYYMKKHPMKVFMLVIMPLITGGALTGLLARFGIRLPGGLEKMFGGKPNHGGIGGGSGSGGGVGRDGRGGMQWERTHVESSGGAMEGLGKMVGGMGGIGGAVSLAKMFM